MVAVGRFVTKSFSLTPIYITNIKRAAEIYGLSESEIVRKALDEFFEKIGLDVKN